MAYAPGFTYVSGPYDIRRSVISSGQTYTRGQPVTLEGLGNTVKIATSASSSIFGIALQDAGQSIYGSEVLILVPNEQTVFASFCTGAAASALSAGLFYNLKTTVTTVSTITGVQTSYANLVVDSSSTASALVGIVSRGDGTTVDSTDSSVFVQFLGNKLAPFAPTQIINVL